MKGERPDAVYYYRRSIELRAGVKLWVVYAVTPIPGEKPDPVPVRGYFPESWRPEGELGMNLYKHGAPAGIFETVIPRNRFKHFEQISEAEALELYPELLEQQLRAGEYLPAERYDPSDRKAR